MNERELIVDRDTTKSVGICPACNGYGFTGYTDGRPNSCSACKGTGLKKRD